MAANVVHGHGVILKCQTWLAENYDRADVVTEVVRVSGFPKRTFDRRFRTATGYSPLAYVQALRIDEAKQMLETGTAAVTAISREVGYEDVGSFRRLFRRLAGMSPGDYRRRFRIPRSVAEAAAAVQEHGASPSSSRAGSRRPRGSVMP
jgi:transcriptional regulator GlxA family with amidase domain